MSASGARSGSCRRGGDGSYGTSISLYKAVEDTNDVIIAYKQNGRRAHARTNVVS